MTICTKRPWQPCFRDRQANSIHGSTHAAQQTPVRKNLDERMIKIIEGEFGSRILDTPEDGSRTRPYTARLRNSVFNQLRGWFEGARVLDLCAGVGTVGLEAVSRGAAKVVMVEQSRDVYKYLRRNIETLGCGDRAQAVCGDAMSESTLAHAPTPVDLIFVDPPFQMIETESSRRRVLRQVARCRSVMGDRGFLVLRSPIGPPDVDFTIPGFEGPEVQRHKREHWIMLYAPGEIVPSDDARDATASEESA